MSMIFYPELAVGEHLTIWHGGVEHTHTERFFLFTFVCRPARLILSFEMLEWH
ncbi:hypothetical protein NTE_00696 [Candidatus Nitrososphaera evergladensis SR1]|uniref:Uncharacterized protein n=1 Tax=Candidatus Nitrososphaera evergladensis SR1 TaxID=1459636 RepID=A0A075MMV8_9ARCH|nr:hypothetical protein NTE_00696 [Candidatus Nitrososphaera evergladensis SR1]